MSTRTSANDAGRFKDAEARIKASTRDAGSHSQSDDAKECFKLRAQSAAMRQELDAQAMAMKKLKKVSDATSKELHESEMGRKATEEYARKLEQKLERSGKGVALMKAVRLQSDVEFLERQVSHLHEELRGKEAKIEEMMREVAKQRQIADEAAKANGLPGWQSLEELSDLRLRVQSLADSLNEREDKIRRQQEDLNDFRVYRSERASIQGRVDELEALISQAEDDKAALIEAYDDQKRQLERSKTLISELTASRDEFAHRTNELEGKKAELERLLREQVVIMSATKQQTESLEANLHQMKRSQLQVEKERDELRHLVVSSEKQRSAISLELLSMSENMQGVLGLGRLEQAELHARANELTHRITNALQGHPSPSFQQLDDTAEGVLISLTRCSRQQEALIEQFLSLKDQLRSLSDVQMQNQNKKEIIERRELEIQQINLSKKELEKQLRDQSSAWAQLAVSTSGSLIYSLGKEMEVASLVLLTLSQLRSSHETLTFKLQEVTRERDRLRRNNEGLNEGMRSRQEAMSGLVSVQDLNSAVTRIEQLEESSDLLRIELQKAHDSHMVDLSELTRTKERMDELRHRSALTHDEDQREKERLSHSAEEAREATKAAMRLVGQLQGAMKDREGEILRLKAKLALQGGSSREPIPASPPPKLASPGYRPLSPPRQVYESSFTFQPMSPPSPAPFHSSALSPPSARRHQSPLFPVKAHSPQPARRPRPKTPVSSSDDDSDVGDQRQAQPLPAPQHHQQPSGKPALSPKGKQNVDRNRKEARDQISALVQTYKKLGRR